MIQRKAPASQLLFIAKANSLIRFGLYHIDAANAPRPVSFRAGRFAANAETLLAHRANGIQIHFSIDPTIPISVADQRDGRELLNRQTISGALRLPIDIFRNGFRKVRDAQIGACSSKEIIQGIESAERLGWNHIVLLSHTFEMLRVGANVVDKLVANRFEQACKFLGSAGGGVIAPELPPPSWESLSSPCGLPMVSRAATLRPYAGQALDRIL